MEDRSLQETILKQTRVHLYEHRYQLVTRVRQGAAAGCLRLFAPFEFQCATQIILMVVCETLQHFNLFFQATLPFL